jgi:uroporphyrinogen-III synthase
MIAPTLAGRRVLVTRAQDDSEAWAERLSALGAEPVILPCIRTEMIDDAGTRAALATALRDAHWLCVTSARGVEAVQRLAGPLPPALRVAAVGTVTAGAVRELLGRAPFVARGGTSRALGEELLAAGLASSPSLARIVVAAAQGGRTDAEEVLARAGATVRRIDVYRTVPASPNAAPMDLVAERIGDILLTSPSAVEGLLNQASFPATTRIFTLGPTTSAAVVAAGLSVWGEAVHPDFDSLVEVMQ